MAETPVSSPDWLPNQQEHRGLGRVAALAAVVGWSAGNVIVAQFDMPGLAIGFWRLLLGAAIYGVVFYATGKRLTWAQARMVLPVAAAFSLEIGVYFVALKHTTVANATIIGSLQTIVLIAVAARRYQERIGAWMTGIATVALIGVVVVVVGAKEESAPGLQLRGDLLAAIAMVFFSIYFIKAKEVRTHIDAFALQTAMMAIGALVLLPLAAIDAGRVLPVFPTWTQWGWLALLLAVPGTGHYLMNWAHLHVSLSLVAILTLAVPVLSAAGAWLFLDQQLTIIQVTGMSVVLTSLLLAVRRDVEPTAGT